MNDRRALTRASRRRVMRTAAAAGGALAAGYITPDLLSLGTPIVIAAVSGAPPGVPKGPPPGVPKGPPLSAGSKR
jgi:hypothetical protein